MIILNVNNVSLSFGTNKILDNVTFYLQEGKKVGLVGVNGAGKSTLFKILCGIYQPDTGEIFISKSLKTAYLAQNTGLDSSNTIWEEVLTAFEPIIQMEKRLKQLETIISVEKDDTVLQSRLKEYSTLTDKFTQNGGYEYTSRCRGVLKGLGFAEDQFVLSVRSLSGGQKTRLALAMLLLEEPDLLLLDEPTNHLDIEAIEWLEEFLKQYRKSVFIISHDRYFLDAVTSQTIEIENLQSTTYEGNYSSYVQQKALNRELQQKHFDLQQKEIARMEAFIEQQRRWNREKNIVAAESRMKAIDRIEKIDKPSNLPSKINIKFKSGVNSGNDVLYVDDLAKQYPGRKLFDNVSFKLEKNDRAFVMGPNGCGKSTMLKIVCGKLPQDSGSVEFGANVVLGYYDQELEGLDEEKTIIEEVWSANEKLTQTEIRTALASFLFSGEDVFKPISVLSGGEKSRVALVKLMLSGSNFLILDEPTNHLDINSREILEGSLQNFDGTILAVSHDRYFIKKLSSRIIEFNPQGVLDFKGDYEYYLDYRKEKAIEANSIAVDENLSVSKLERLESKEQKSRKRKLEKQLTDTEGEITRIETRLSKIDEEMLSPQLQSDHVKLTELLGEQVRLKTSLDELYDLWSQLTEDGD